MCPQRSSKKRHGLMKIIWVIWFGSKPLTSRPGIRTDSSKPGAAHVELRGDFLESVPPSLSSGDLHDRGILDNLPLMNQIAVVVGVESNGDSVGSRGQIG